MTKQTQYRMPEETRKRFHPEVASWIEGYAQNAPDVQSGDEEPGDVAEAMVRLFDLHAAANRIDLAATRKHLFGGGSDWASTKDCDEAIALVASLFPEPPGGDSFTLYGRATRTVEDLRSRLKAISEIANRGVK